MGRSTSVYTEVTEPVPKDTTIVISVTPSSLVVGEGTSFRARATLMVSPAGTPLVGMGVTITCITPIKTLTWTLVTNNLGQAECTYVPEVAGSHEWYAEFAGTKEYRGC